MHRFPKTKGGIPKLEYEVVHAGEEDTVRNQMTHHKPQPVLHQGVRLHFHRYRASSLAIARWHDDGGAVRDAQ